MPLLCPPSLQPFHLEGQMEYNCDPVDRLLTCILDSTSTQKPDDELYATFKQNFPGLGSSHGATAFSAAPSAGTTSISKAEPLPSLGAR